MFIYISKCKQISISVSVKLQFEWKTGSAVIIDVGVTYDLKMCFGVHIDSIVNESLRICLISFELI